MAKSIRFAALLLVGGVSVGNLWSEQARGPASLEELRSRAVVNWSAPLYWSPGSESTREKSTTGAASSALPFIAVPPCRLADTRDSSFPPGFGPPSLVGGAARTFTLPGRCGLPSEAAAYSLNITVIPPANPPFSFLSVYPTGGSAPAVSTLNWGTGGTSTVYFNAAIVPAGSGGGIDVFVSSGTDLILDVNGYYANNLTPQNGQFTLTSDVNGGNSGAGALVVHNSDPAGANSWGGQFLSDSCNAGSAGVYGEATNTSSCGATFGVWGRSRGTTDGSTGVVGEGLGATGVVFGVTGSTASGDSGAAGVKGSSSGGLPNVFGGTMGIYGTNGSGGFGVLGISPNRGVQGSRTDATGDPLSSGVLGYDGTAGVFSFNDYAGVGAKYFVEPHPTDASKQIGYIALEGPEAGTYFRGRGKFVAGRAVIPVPEDFRMVTEEEGLTVQITPLGRMAQVGVVSVDLNNVVAESSQDVEFSYLVQGVRLGYSDMRPIQENVYFVPMGPSDRMGPYPDKIRKRLVALGIYKDDGTVNMETAERLGWTKTWPSAPPHP